MKANNFYTKVCPARDNIPIAKKLVANIKVPFRGFRGKTDRINITVLSIV
jgi:hypothetical protein